MYRTDKNTRHWEALKLSHPELFEVSRGLELAHHCYDLLGNTGLLQMPMLPVHVRHAWSAEERRNYKNRCILEARNGAVLISPFISPDEKQVMDVALSEGLSVVMLTVDALSDYVPSDALLAPLAQGRMLIMNPWPDRPRRAPLTRLECQTLNRLAGDIAAEDWFE